MFLTGGDQSKLRTLVGSRVNDLLEERLDDGLIVAGTSAGATAMGRTMILGGNGSDVSAATVRTGPGLGLVPRALIDMHFGERGRLPRLLSAVALDPDHLGLGLDENTGILVDDTGFEVLGSGVATIVDAEDATVVHAAGDTDPITLFGVRLHLLPAGCLFDFGTRTAVHRPRPRQVLAGSRSDRLSTASTKGADVRFIDLRHLSGPNVFTTSPVSVARLELDELTSKETTDFGGFADRLTALLPGLADHHCAAGRPGGFLEAMERGTYFGHVTEHVALELSGLAGRRGAPGPDHVGGRRRALRRDDGVPGRRAGRLRVCPPR